MTSAWSQPTAGGSSTSSSSSSSSSCCAFHGFMMVLFSISTQAANLSTRVNLKLTCVPCKVATCCLLAELDQHARATSSSASSSSSSSRVKSGETSSFWSSQMFYFWLEITFIIWMFPKIVGFPPKSSIFNRVFHYFHHPFWGTTIFGNTYIAAHTQYTPSLHPSQIRFLYFNFTKSTEEPSSAGAALALALP